MQLPAYGFDHARALVSHNATRLWVRPKCVGRLRPRLWELDQVLGDFGRIWNMFDRIRGNFDQVWVELDLTRVSSAKTGAGWAKWEGRVGLTQGGVDRFDEVK